MRILHLKWKIFKWKWINSNKFRKAFNQRFFEDNKISIWSYFLRMQSARLGSGTLLLLCIPDLAISYLEQANLCFAVCRPTSSRSIARGCNSSQKRPYWVGHAFRSVIRLPSPGSHLNSLILTKAEQVQIGEKHFPQLADIADVVQLGGSVIVLEADFFNVGHPNSVDGLHRFDVVPIEIELAEVLKLYPNDEMNDPFVEDVH